MADRVLGAVLAGGASSRFGSDKAVAVLAGRTLLDHARATLAGVVGEVVVVGREDGVPDRPVAGLGPLGGIAGALFFAEDNRFASVLTIACDMPAVPEGLLAALLTEAPSYCADAPVLGHWPVAAGEPLLMRLAKLGDHVLHHPGEGRGGERSGSGSRLSVRRWAESIGALAIPSPVPLANINTPQDLAR